MNITWNLFKEFVGGFAWCLKLGKAETEQIKGEIEDLLNHSSQSFKSLIELTDTVQHIPQAQFNQQTFGPIANHCRWFFTSPDAAQKARTHCTDIHRDIGRINFKMAKVLRTEGGDWKGISGAFSPLLDADRSFLNQYSEELERIGKELDAIDGLLQKGDAEPAWRMYTALRDSLLTSKRSLSDEIALMQKAQTHIHELLA